MHTHKDKRGKPVNMQANTHMLTTKSAFQPKQNKHFAEPPVTHSVVKLFVSETENKQLKRGL